MSIDIYKEATRRKLRFETAVGVITADDLWDLPLAADRGPSVTALARGLTRALTTAEDPSWLGARTSSKEERLRADNELRLLIIRDVYETRQAEIAAKNEADKKASARRKLAEVIEQRKDAELLSLGLEELEQKLRDLG